MTSYQRITTKTVTQKGNIFGPAVVTEDVDETNIEGSADDIILILNEAEYEEDPQPVTNIFNTPQKIVGHDE